MGSALEYYDFALYSLASALIFGKIFFPGLGASRRYGGQPAPTLAIGFLARPLGGSSSDARETGWAANGS